MTSTSKALEVRTKKGIKFGRELRKEFLFDEKYTPLNHGSFGTYPRPLHIVRRDFQDQVEARPDDFIFYRYPRLLEKAREAMSKVLNAPTPELVFVPNATTGVNIVLKNLVYEPGDHILYFSTIYGGCEKAVAYICETTPTQPVRIAYAAPVEDDWLVSEFKKTVKEVEAKGGRVKVAIFDTVISVPGIRMPFERLVEACKELGVLSCLDGAHGVGHVELDLSKLDADFFVSNCHKWFHVPRGCAVFHVPLRNQHLIRTTLPTSHGFVPLPSPHFANVTNPMPPSATPKSLFEINFEFTGTMDTSPYLCIPASLQWRESLGGEQVIRDYCWTLAQEGGKIVADRLGTEIMENSTGTLTKCCMSNVKLPINVNKVQKLGTKAGIEKAKVASVVRGWMSKTLVDDYATFMMIMFYNGQWWVRLSAQVYLETADFEWAAETLKKLCERVEKGEWVRVPSKL